MGNIIIFFTKEAKIYEKHGLDAEPVVMSGSGIASRALIAGSVTISPITTPAVMSAVLAGSDMVILAHTMPGVIQSLMVRPDIKRAEDLKGKNNRCHNLRFARVISLYATSPGKRGSIRTRTLRYANRC